jgi:hypothetical protein
MAFAAISNEQRGSVARPRCRWYIGLRNTSGKLSQQTPEGSEPEEPESCESDEPDQGVHQKSDLERRAKSRTVSRTVFATSATAVAVIFQVAWIVHSFLFICIFMDAYGIYVEDKSGRTGME